MHHHDHGAKPAAIPDERHRSPDKSAHREPEGAMLRLREKENLVDNVWAFRFEPRKPLAWTPGQFIRVELAHDNPDDEGTKRWFTISSAPYEGIVQITTRVTDSTFKQVLHALPLGGQLAMVEEPDGDFVWQDTDRPLVFIAGGIGVTPFRSILKQRAHDGLALAATLVYGNRTNAIVFKDEFDTYAARDDSFELKYVTGEPLNAVKLKELIPGLDSSLVYLSGPEPMVEALGNELKATGLAEGQLKQDFFPHYNETNY